jgi:hypothetical protein
LSTVDSFSDFCPLVNTIIMVDHIPKCYLTARFSSWLCCRTVMNKLPSPDEDQEAYLAEVKEVLKGINKSNAVERVLSSKDHIMAA